MNTSDEFAAKSLGRILACKLLLYSAVLTGILLACPCSRSWAAETPEAFLQRYFNTLTSAKSLDQLKPFYTPDKDAAKTDEMLQDPTASAFALAMVKSEPSKVKILSRKTTQGVVTFKLAPLVIPPQYSAESKKAGFSMTGEVVLHAKGDSWLVHKDYWQVKSIVAGGTGTLSFGRNPDGDNDKGSILDSSASPSILPEAKDFEGQLRDRLMNAWQTTGNGDSIYVVFRLQPDGKVSELSVKGEKAAQPAAEAQISQLFASVTLPSLPPDQHNKPVAWMMFDWHDGSRSISGPYFDETAPSWLLKKMSGGSSTQQPAPEPPSNSSKTPDWLTP